MRQKPIIITFLIIILFLQLHVHTYTIQKYHADIIIPNECKEIVFPGTYQCFVYLRETLHVQFNRSTPVSSFARKMSTHAFATAKLLNVTDASNKSLHVQRSQIVNQTHILFAWNFPTIHTSDVPLKFVAMYKINGLLRSSKQQNTIFWSVVEDHWNVYIYNISCHVHVPIGHLPVTTYPSNATAIDLITDTRIEFAKNQSCIGNSFDIAVQFPQQFECDTLPTFMIGIYVISSVGILTLSVFVVIYVVKMVKDLASVKPDGVYPEGYKPSTPVILHNDSFLYQSKGMRWSSNSTFSSINFDSHEIVDSNNNNEDAVYDEKSASSSLL